MSTGVAVKTYIHSITFVTDKILTTIKEIIRLSGLNPSALVEDWEVLERGIKKWLETKDLEEVCLEVFNSRSNRLVGRWDFEIYYGEVGDGSFWLDPDAVKYHIIKQGIYPSDCKYKIVTTTKPGRPNVNGWYTTQFRSTAGFVKQSIGTTIDGNGLSTGTGYWRKA